MRSLTHLADHVVLQQLKSLATRERTTMAELLAHLAEADERRLHLPSAYPSMHLYCVHELGLSSDEAFKRIRVARAAREFPEILSAIADARLHLSAVVQLAPHLTSQNASDLLAAAAHKSKVEIAFLLAERFPVLGAAAGATGTETGGATPDSSNSQQNQLVPEPVGPCSADSSPVVACSEPPRPNPAPAAHIDLTLRIGRTAHEKLRYAQSLLGHAVPSQELAAVIERGMDALIEKLERRIFAAAGRTRPRRGAAKGRHVPAELRREVWHRDGGRCTFTSDRGQRCPSCTRLEFDHLTPVARGGETTLPNLRLRCRAHNQYEAERTYGAGFMARKRQEAKELTARGRVAARGEAMRSVAEARHEDSDEQSIVPTQAELNARRNEIIPWLRQLGFRATEAKQAAALCDALQEQPLEARVRFALAGLGRERYLRSTPGALASG